MDAEFKSKWIAALRSGNYKQGIGRLKRKNLADSTPSYCCLGVACEIGMEDYGLTQTMDVGGVTLFLEGNADYSVRLPTTFSGNIGVDYSIEIQLIEMNDVQRLSFSQIANWIEAHV